MIERRNPLPAGVRYWQNFTTAKSKADGRSWIQTQMGMGNARLITEEGDAESDADVWFMMFDAIRPMPWAALELGFPTVAAPQSAKTRSQIDPLHKEPPFDWSVFAKFAAAGAAPLFIFLGALALLSGGNSRR